MAKIEKVFNNLVFLTPHFIGPYNETGCLVIVYIVIYPIEKYDNSIGNYISSFSMKLKR